MALDGALDHAIETLYHPNATEKPAKSLALAAVEALFVYLPKCRAEMENEEFLTRAQLAAFSHCTRWGWG